MNNDRETLLDVMGMSCPSCVRHINEALKDLDGVRTVDVRLQDGKVLVKHDPQSTPVDALVDALHEAGYESSLASRAVAQ